jgi:glycosyltransferase involved in cell wall biosynthesis
MEIYIDNIIFKLQPIGGISVYFAELIRRFLSSELDVKFIEHSSDHTNVLREGLDIRRTMIVPERPLPSSLARYTPIPLKLRERAIVHSSYYRTCYDRNAVNIVTVYDFTYEYFRSGLPRYIHAFMKRRSITNADGVICISENTRQDLLSIHKGTDTNRVAVIPLSANSAFGPSACQRADEISAHVLDAVRDTKFVLYVGERVHHKNFGVAVEALSRLPNYRLVVAGGAKLSGGEAALLHERLHGRYTYLGKVKVPDLNYLYNKAFCLLYPSSYEGFGIPILEAMQAGCPVISTRLASIPEVAGDAGLLVDRVDADAFVERILSLEDPALRDDVIRAGFAQAGKFSWDRTYRETIQFYEKVASTKLQP